MFKITHSEAFMGTGAPKGFQGALRSTKEVLAIVISVISFIISTVNVYVTNLKAPDLSIIVAPYIRQIVDNTSLNEAFFIPMTVVNQGAKPGSILSFELVATYLPTGEQTIYYGQYFAQKDNPELLGSFFTPINVAGYSTAGQTLCFYPLGEREGNFFGRTGAYEFSITGRAANVKGQALGRILQVFRVELTQEMYEQMQKEPDLEYRYPLPVEVISNKTSLIEILRNIGK
jgi:hypothetical protein